MSQSDRYCIDKLTPHHLAQRESAATELDSASLDYGRFWKNGSSLRVKFYAASAGEQFLAIKWANTWSQYGNIKFVLSFDEDAEIRISHNPGEGSWSYLGKDCLEVPTETPTMNLGSLERGVVMHQFGHALGFPHERLARAQQADWNLEALYAAYACGPNGWSRAQVDRHFLKPLQQDWVRDATFDPDSIMAPIYDAGWLCSADPSTKCGHKLSRADQAFVGSMAAYPKASGITLAQLEAQLALSRRQRT